MLSLLKKLFGGSSVDYKQLVSEGAVIIDVRTPGEFKSGHIKGAINIPLDQIRSKIPELKKKNKKLITCCRSGSRSGMAKGILVSAGLDCVNGGPWDSLNRKIA